MKRQFSARPRNGGILRSSWAWGLIIVVIVLLFALRTFAPGIFTNLAAPVWQGGTALNAASGNMFANFMNKAKLEQQNTALEQQVQTLTSENQILDARTQDVTKLLGGTNGVSGELLAGVLAGPPESPYDTLTISAGSSDGVSAGALVYTAGGTPVGTVQSVTSHTSQISLFSTAGRSTNGWVGQNRVPVVLTGEGAGGFKASLPQSSGVAVGDTVYVPGPGALPIGTVVKVGTDPSSPTETIFIQPLVNVFSITWVEVARS